MPSHFPAHARGFSMQGMHVRGTAGAHWTAPSGTLALLASRKCRCDGSYVDCGPSVSGGHLRCAPLAELASLFSAIAAVRRSDWHLPKGGGGETGAGAKRACLELLSYSRIRLLRLGVVEDGYHGISKGSRIERDCDVPLPSFECRATARASNGVRYRHVGKADD